MPVLGSLLFPALPLLRTTLTVAPMRAWRAEGEEASRTESSMQLMLGHGHSTGQSEESVNRAKPDTRNTTPTPRFATPFGSQRC